MSASLCDWFSHLGVIVPRTDLGHSIWRSTSAKTEIGRYSSRRRCSYQPASACDRDSRGGSPSLEAGSRLPNPFSSGVAL